MNKNLIAILPLALALFLASARASQQEQPQQPRPAPPRLSLMDAVKKSLQRVGASIDASKSTAQMVVSNYTDPRGGKTTVVIVNDRVKNLLGLYIYNFGSLKSAANKEEVYKYLLLANDAITIGGFFVDNDEDIGYKYLMNVGQSLNQPAFESAYLTMAAVARDRRSEIRKLLGLSSKEDRSSDVKKAAEERTTVKNR
jgi:hypothetical protein